MYLVRDLKQKKHIVIDDNPMTGFFVNDSKDYEVLFEFEQNPFPNLKCSDCGTEDETCKERSYGYGVQCYKCYKDDKDFEDEYR